MAKQEVKAHWEGETCGIRYGASLDRVKYFEEISRRRYELEPYIPMFADFPSAAGKNILEIGVGAGADFVNWCRHATHATGIDLTEAAIELTQERCRLAGFENYTLQEADAENLPFSDNSFDLVYAYGVLHHSPDTERAFREVNRVLKPGGEVRTMVYHVHSWVALMLKLRFGGTLRSAVFKHLESPGTKAYSKSEFDQLMLRAGFSDIECETRLSPGDLLTIKPSHRYNSWYYRLVWALYPRWLTRILGDRFGMNLLVRGRKPG